MNEVAAEVDDRVPAAFCWTRFGTEAGEPIEAIFRRKEKERRATHGMFLWGIGNSIAPAIRALLELQDSPSVLFSPIASRPRTVDVLPSRVARWRSAETLTGETFDLPDEICVTSRHSGRGAHYALVCRAAGPLRPADNGSISFQSLRNLLSGRPLGASQVTAVVQRGDAAVEGRKYGVAIKATLAAPYFLKLGTPVDAVDGAPLTSAVTSRLF